MLKRLLAVIVASCVVAGAVAADAQVTSLARLRQVDVSVDLEYPLDVMTAADLVARLMDGLNRAEPPFTVSDRATDHIRLTVAVRPMSATALRGFWLPFSGTYAVGAVRLGVERAVTLPGVPRPFPAVVWQTERVVGAPFHASEREIVRVLDEMVAELLDARR
jgi:hypothetical protein